MSSVVRFLKNFFLYPREMGALFATGAAYSKLACKQVDWNRVRYVAELGAGDGSVTQYIIDQLKPEQKLLVFESNGDLFQQLQRKFGDRKNVVLIHDSAEFLKKYAEQEQIDRFDAIFSEVPLVSLPEAVTNNIFLAIKDTLKKDGLFLQISYSTFGLKRLKQEFEQVMVKFTFFNLPPAFLYLIRY